VLIAPSQDRSGLSHGILNTTGGTVVRSIELDGTVRGYAVEGSPAEAVAIGIKALGGDRGFDLVVSGINRGENLGLSNLYSGTVNAAMEGVLRGVPAIAISRGGDGSDYTLSAAFARRLVAEALEQKLPMGVMLNVNVPGSTVKGVKVVRASVGQRMALQGFDATPLGTGVTRYTPRVGRVDSQPASGDVAAYLAGNITIAPLALDRTAIQAIPTVRRWGLQPPQRKTVSRRSQATGPLHLASISTVP